MFDPLHHAGLTRVFEVDVGLTWLCASPCIVAAVVSGIVSWYVYGGPLTESLFGDYDACFPCRRVVEVWTELPSCTLV